MTREDFLLELYNVQLIGNTPREAEEVRKELIAAFVQVTACDAGPKIDAALQIAARYGGVDGDHHKAWVIDQMVRVLAGDQYEAFVQDTCKGSDGLSAYEWDIGIAP